MPRLTLFLTTLCAGLAAATLAAAATTTADPEAAYQAMLAQAQASAPNYDWQALRMAYAERPGFQVFAQSAAKRQMRMDMEHSDCATALPEARAVIAEAYIDAEAHMVVAFCDDAAGDAPSAQRERDIGVGLLKSIETGDGLTPAAAFTVIDIDEEYSLMRGLGRKVTSQSLLHIGGHSYDAVAAVDDKGQSATYYFLVDRVLAAEAAVLRPGSVSEGGPPSRTP